MSKSHAAVSATRLLRIIVPALFALGSAAACGRGESGGGPEWLAADPRQVDLEIALDAARARTREIGPEGGTLTATGDDGTRFQLQIPAGALLAPERITMTPVREVRGLPLKGGDFVTVQLEPSGLRLLQAATLTIRTKREIPAGEQVAFAYHGTGQDAHLYPLGLDPKRIEMRLQHFSGYGFGRAAPDDPGRLALQRATAVEARQAAQVAELVARAKRGELDGAALMDAVAAVSVAYYDQVLAGLLRTAETDDRMAACALDRTFAWQRDALMAGSASDDAAKRLPSAVQERFDLAGAALPRIVENAYKQGYERLRKACRGDDVFRSANGLLALDRQMHLLGLRPEAMKNVYTAVEECLRFEVEFRSVFDTKSPTGASHHDVVATMQTSIPFPPHAPIDSTQLRYVGFTASGDPAADFFGSTMDALGVLEDARGTVAPVGTKPGTFVLHALGWEVQNAKDSVLVTNCEGEDEKAAQEVVDTLIVTFAPGVPREVVRFTPKNARSQFPGAVADMFRNMGQGQKAAELDEAARLTPSIMEEQHWAEHWAHTHRDQELGRVGTRNFDDVGGLYALKLARVELGVWRADTNWTQPATMGYSMSEQSHLTVRHVP
jgi:hypothetical protein